MSLLPYILSELHDLSAAVSEAPRRSVVEDLLDDLVLLRDTPRSLRPAVLRVIDSPHQLLLRPRHLRRLQHAAPLKKTKKGDKKKDNDAFSINVDVQQFHPEELSVQVLKDEGFVVVEGKHEERPDEHGYIQRQFTRRYKLPPNVDPDTVTSRLTSDGVLCVSAPRKDALPAPKESNVRHVPIAQTNRPAVEGVEDKGDKERMVNGEEKVANGEEKMEL